MMPGNRFYLYNFIYDNCTTRIKDGLFKHATINEYSIGINSFREEVVSAPYKGGLGWVGLGIDLLLGAVSDQRPTLFQEAFLPILLYKKLVLNSRIVSATQEIKYNSKKPESDIAPITILILFLALYIFTSGIPKINAYISGTKFVRRWPDWTLRASLLICVKNNGSQLLELTQCKAVIIT